MMKKCGIYIHIPFCKVKCIYCDFYSITEREHQREEFTHMLCREIELFKVHNKNNFIIDTIFIGGGTPSLLTVKQLNAILNSLVKTYSLDNVTEITLEANPGEISKKKLTEFKKLGINRISFGFQSLQKELLKFLTRIHTKEEAINSYINAKDVGFENINIDLIFSIPNQSLSKLENDLKIVSDLNPNHISAYSLTVEPGTELKRLVKKNKVIMPRNKLDLEMLTFTRQFLNNQGYNAYEISNFSKPNFECKHNLNYWNSGPYLAFGPSAHGYDLVNRWSNIRSIDGYIKKLRNFESPIVNIEMSSKSNKFNETLLNGLRLKKGVCLEKLKSLDQNYNEYLNHGLSKWKKEISIDNKYLSLTKEGIPFLDSILPDLFI